MPGQSCFPLRLQLIVVKITNHILGHFQYHRHAFMATSNCSHQEYTIQSMVTLPSCNHAMKQKVLDILHSWWYLYSGKLYGNTMLAKPWWPVISAIYYRFVNCFSWHLGSWSIHPDHHDYRQTKVLLWGGFSCVTWYWPMVSLYHEASVQSGPGEPLRLLRPWPEQYFGSKEIK